MEALSPGILLSIILGYFLMLILVSIFTSRNANNQDFFNAGRNSPWYLVAIGMIGASLSGVTFISIPGVVGNGGVNQAFSYMQIVFGYLLGYAVIALVLLPLYYRLNLTSIYTYLENRFGWHAYKIGAVYFQLSRTTGSALRLFLVATILHQFVFAPYQIPFALSVFMSIFLIWVYTFKGGIKTIVVTDTIQTFFMMGAVFLTIILICQQLNMGMGDMYRAINNSGYGKVFFFEGGWSDPNNFFKQFLSGALITLTMTGLDQDMMQKNLTCRTLKDAQKNMFTFSIILVFANILFLTMGAMLYIYASELGITLPEKSDQVYPFLALNHLSPFIGILFIVGLIAAAYSSADSALAAMTTSFCIDFLNFEKWDATEEKKKRIRLLVHIGYSFLMFFMILIFNTISKDGIINELFRWAGFTYGPLLGLFAFGILTQFKVRSQWIIPICLLSPIISWLLDTYSKELFQGFTFGFLTLAINGLMTFLGLLLASERVYKVVE